MNRSSSTQEARNTKTKVFARKTEMSSQYKEIDSPTALNCVIHGTSHRLSKCREFTCKPLKARKNLLRKRDSALNVAIFNTQVETVEK
jgi:hypothetical protein